MATSVSLHTWYINIQWYHFIKKLWLSSSNKVIIRDDRFLQAVEFWAKLRNLPVSLEFCRILYFSVISDTIGHMTNDAISDTLIVYLTIIEIVDAFIGFVSFNS